MTLKNTVSVILVLAALVLSACGGKKFNLDPNDPLFKDKFEFINRYGFYVNELEFELLRTLPARDGFEKFKVDFWKVRDPDPRTEVNELKAQIDQRIKDIENEIFATDIDTPGVRFDRNGGLKGDMAHVYLLYGAPSFKAKLSQGLYHGELMVWYYFDAKGRSLMRFLFYDNGQRAALYKDQFVIVGGLEELFNPAFSPLKKLSNRPGGANTYEDLVNLWYELERSDPEWIFRTPIFEFSTFHDVVIEGGNGKTTFGALDVPEPAALTAERFKPKILGQPGDLSKRNFIFSKSNSFIPVELKISSNSNSGKPSFSFEVKYKNIDWEIKDKLAEAFLNLRISFQNNASKKLTEFEAGIVLQGPRYAVEALISIPDEFGRDRLRLINTDQLENWAVREDNRSDRPTLRQIVDNLAPGEYIVNIHLSHALTKKYNSWQEKIIIR